MASSLQSSRILNDSYTIAFLSCLFIEGEVCANARYNNNEELLKVTNPEEVNIKRSDFPSEFVFGAATAAPQIEGATNQYGKGPSIWDEFAAENPGKIADFSKNKLRGIKSYERYKSDIEYLKRLGVDSYRFSISWPRILPSGSLSGGINQEGINHYNNVIDELVKHGIKPFVTLLHFDLPQELQDKYGGFLSSSIVKDFKDYAKICFKAFGDRVKNWITINEPLIVAQMGYDLGVAAPGRCSAPFIAGPCNAGNSSIEPYIVTHNVLLAHAAAVKLYRLRYQQSQRGEIGISHVGKYLESYSESPEDKAAAKRVLDFELGWFMEPLVYGDYPESMKNLVKERLPSFSKKEKELIKGSFDFIGINYYTSRYARASNISMDLRYSNDPLATQETEKEGIPIGPKAEGSSFLYVYPEGLQKLLWVIKERYQSPKIYITENGVTEVNQSNRTLDQALRDPHRTIFILRHLYRVREAIKLGVNVKGYFYWALFDDFEWGDGYTIRFGLYHIDYQDNLKRIPKESAKWLPTFLKT
ncbi:hypothetical protein UlMin_008805 [Ulmus minor]